MNKSIVTAATKLGQGYVFTGVCDSVHRGGMHGCLGGVHGCWGVCVVAGGACMVARGHAWLLGGVHGCGGACVFARGLAW